MIAEICPTGDGTFKRGQLAEMSTYKTITLAYTGASGMLYGLRLLELLLAGKHQVYLLYSQAAQIVAHQELQLVLPSRPREAEQLFRKRFNASEGQLRVSDGRNGSRPWPQVPTRRMRW